MAVIDQLVRPHDPAVAPSRSALVFGASGHTGRFVVSELCSRGWRPILSGRDVAKLEGIRSVHPGLEIRLASVAAPESLDLAVAGAAAVINCAGPFEETSAPMIEAALRARIPYLDVSGEPELVAAEFERYADRARAAEIVVAPAMAFYGAMGDLLATAAMGQWAAADEISVAYALNSWKPTPGTRLTMERMGKRRAVFTNARMEIRTDRPPIANYVFPAPLGALAVVPEFPTADTVTISRHLKTPEIRTFMTVASLKDLTAHDAEPPGPIDAYGRSSQTFVVEAVVRSGGMERRAVARGRDIYAITAPIIVEAMQRILSGQVNKVGVATAGELFDSRDFLQSLCPAHLSIQLP